MISTRKSRKRRVWSGAPRDGRQGRRQPYTDADDRATASKRKQHAEPYERFAGTNSGKENELGADERAKKPKR